MKQFQADHLSVHIHPNREEAGKCAADEAARAIRAAIVRNGAARIILASAPSQNEFLAALRIPEIIDWSRVTIFHMDEYLGLDANNQASFRYYLNEHLIAHITPAQFHAIQGEAEESQAECRRYSELLAQAPIDVVCLGIGENGHIAFNDPPVADFADPLAVKIVELDEACRHQQVNDGCFPNFQAVPRHAITLTVPALMGGREMICVVPGMRKAAAVRATIEDPISTLCPATVIRQHTRAQLYLDPDSASYL